MATKRSSKTERDRPSTSKRRDEPAITSNARPLKEALLRTLRRKREADLRRRELSRWEGEGGPPYQMPEALEP